MKRKINILKNRIWNAFKKRPVRIACGSVVTLLVATIVIGSLIAQNGEEDNTLPPHDTKAYIDLIVEYMLEVNNDDDVTNDKEFTILEIVPYKGMGEFYHYVHHDEVTDGIAQHLADTKDEWFKTYAAYKFEDYQGLSNFEYQIMYRTNEQEYFVKSSEYFLKYIVPEYAFALDNHIKVNVCEANDLTEADIEEADMIIVQTATHDGQTVEGYQNWAGEPGSQSYTLDLTNNTATEVSINSIKYSHYEEITSIIGTPEEEKFADREKIEITDSDEKGFEITRTFVSRDASWVAAKKLMDVCLDGRELTIGGETKKLRTPVVMDGAGYGELAGTYNDANMFKFLILERMIGPAEEGYKATYADIKEGFVYDYENIDNNAKNQLGVATARLQFKNAESCSVKWPVETAIGLDGILNYYIDYYKDDENYYGLANGQRWSVFSYYYNDVRGGEDKIYQMYAPSNPYALSDNFWVHSGTGCLIPVNIETQVASNMEYAGFTAERVGDTTNVTVPDIMRYLLGTTPEVAKEEMKDTIYMLEIEPVNQFKYNNYTNVKQLGFDMGYDVSGWTESNYKDYIQVNCVSTDTFNSLNEDLVATYDVIYFGMEYDKVLAVESSWNPIPVYNDPKLKGYVYLAYGDLVKTSNVLSGLLPYDYGMVGDPATITSAGYIKVDAANVNDGERDQWGNVYSTLRLYPAGNSKWNDYLNSTLTEGMYYVLKDLDQVFVDEWGYYKHNATDYYNEKLGNARLDGNDITEKKYSELVEYIRAEKPFIMADSVYYMDTNLIYPTSNSYKVFEAISLGNYWRGFSYDQCYRVSGAIDDNIPEITFTEKPVEIEYDGTKLLNKMNPDQNAEEIGYQLRYVFDIKGEANATYNVKLILDRNGDGLYDDMAREDDTNEMYYEIQSLKLGADGTAKNVEIEVTLPSELTGPIAWQVQVTKLVAGRETVLKGIGEGYTAVMGDIKDAKILQIYPERSIHMAGIGVPTLTLNMAEDPRFQELLKTAASKINFNIEITALSTKEFEELYKVNADYKIASEYTMIVLGFADIYDLDDISNDYGALDDIQDFMDNGGSVLFTHDMMGFITTPNYATGTYTETKVYASNATEFADTKNFTESEIVKTTDAPYSLKFEDQKVYTSKVVSYAEFEQYRYVWDMESVDGSKYELNPIADATKQDVEGILFYGHTYLVRREFLDSTIVGKDKIYTSDHIPDGEESVVNPGISILNKPTDGGIYYVKNNTWIEDNYNLVVMAVDITNDYKYYKNQILSVVGENGIYEYNGKKYVFVKYRKAFVQVEIPKEVRYRIDKSYTPIAVNNGGVPFQSNWSYNITKTFRNTLGMDKYGVTLTVADREAQNKSKPYYLASKATPYTEIDETTGLYYIEEIQGITDLYLYRFAYAGFVDYVSGSPATLKPYQGFRYLQTSADTSANKSEQDYGLTTNVGKINKGQITQYPYHIPDDLKVAKTHAQYYTLDLEKDPNGDDVVVWYTLEDDGNADETNYYKYTVKDGALNYYIYSKGNITYSGAGHSVIASDDELKLFVNTIIRAITAGNAIPTISVDNGNKSNDGSYVVYRNELAKEYKMLFTPKDTDLLTGYGKFIAGKITCRYTKDGETKTTELKSYGNGELICGEQYELIVTNQEIIDAVERKEADFIFEVTDTYGATGETKAVFSTRYLFELD